MLSSRTARQTSGGLWRDAGYRQLWTADLVSQLGTQVTFLALPLIAVLTLHAAAWQLGLLRAAEYLPAVLALRIGLIVDRRSRRAVLVTADLAQATVLVALPALNAAGVLSFGPLLGVAVILGTFWLAFDVAAQSFLPDVIDQRDLAQANAGLQVSNSAGQLAGPTLATLLIAAVSAPDAVLADVASFLISAALIARVRARVRDPGGKAGGAKDAGPATASRASHGLRFVLAHPQLRPLALASGLTSVAIAITEALLVLYAVRDLRLPTALVGVVFTIGNVGILAGAAVSAGMTRRLGFGRVTVIGLALEVVGLAVLPFAPAGAVAIAVLGCSGLLSTTGIIIYNIGQVTLRQRTAPADLIGQVTAASRFMSLAGLLAGSLIGGGLAELIGVRPALATAAAIAAGGMLTAVLSSLRHADPATPGDRGGRQAEDEPEDTKPGRTR